MKWTLRDASAPALALACFVLLHWKGLGLTVDGWALWQGSVSLAERGTYSYFSGTPIVSWPPLYPLYLGLWIVVLGPAASTVVLADGVLIVLQAAGWVHFARLIVDFPEGRRFGAHAIALAAFIALFATVNQRDVTSHNLLYTLLPFYLGAVWTYALGRSTSIVPMLALGAALPLAHSMALAFVGAGAFIVAILPPRLFHRLALAALIVAAAVASWLVVRLAFGHTASHVIGFGQGQFSPATYLWQMAEGTGWLLAPAADGLNFVALASLLALAVLVARREKAVALRLGLLFVGCAASGVILLFSIVWIFNELYGLYLLFIPFVLVPLVFVAGSHLRPIAALAAMLVALMPQLYWGARWMDRQRLDVRALGFSENHECSMFVPLRAYLSPTYRSGVPVATAQGLLIAPPSFEDRGTRGLFSPNVDCQPTDR
ncbi:MAG: hypothetical protein J0J01_02100 [Reyranella sp.]|uniref:hypothetical protein n=1 Tax=Reyranella sp. TaxID=1929291 RepID=UPI001AD190D3|nr:hypothetical protein [Reyranella sp.]MBN9085675.1 hypothetical protein [Reyranella sp.]